MSLGLNNFRQKIFLVADEVGWIGANLVVVMVAEVAALVMVAEVEWVALAGQPPEPAEIREVTDPSDLGKNGLPCF